MSKCYHPYSRGVDVLNLSTDDGVPFIVGDFVVRAENAMDSLEWVYAPITQKIYTTPKLVA